ncbi:MAG: hypothetical protein GX567_16190 [Clostridia bacterium]|nr:hypothetical protein [Clostridia bacterium]
MKAIEQKQYDLIIHDVDDINIEFGYTRYACYLIVQNGESRKEWPYRSIVALI